LFVVYRGRILDLSGLQSFDQITTLMNVELDRLPGTEQVAALIKYSGHAAWTQITYTRAFAPDAHPLPRMRAGASGHCYGQQDVCSSNFSLLAGR
jgi:hypothetical protein